MLPPRKQEIITEWLARMDALIASRGFEQEAGQHLGHRAHLTNPSNPTSLLAFVEGTLAPLPDSLSNLALAIKVGGAVTPYLSFHNLPLRLDQLTNALIGDSFEWIAELSGTYQPGC